MNSRRLRFPHLRAVLITVGIYVLVAILVRILSLLPLDSGDRAGVTARPPSPATSVETVSESAVPELMLTFSPAGNVPGTWTDAGKTVQLPESVSSCPATGRKWSESDGANLVLVWEPCPDADLAALARKDAATRFSQRLFSSQWYAQSVLPNHADVVLVIESDVVVREWIQSSYRVMVYIRCPGVQTLDCATLSAGAARYLSDRMPGPARADPLPVSTFFPSPNALLASCILLWFLLIGGRILSSPLWTKTYAFDAADPRLTNVQARADAIRLTSQNRRAGWALVGVGVFFAVVTIGPLMRGEPASAAVVAAVAAGVVAGGILFARWRRDPFFVAWKRGKNLSGHPRAARDVPDPLLEKVDRTRWRRWIWDPVRRALAYLLFVLLGAFAIVLPVAAVVGLAVAQGAGMSQVEQLFAAAVVGAALLGYFIDRGGRRLHAYNVRQTRRTDKRGSLLYLRNFGDDKDRLITTALTRTGLWQLWIAAADPIRRSRFEELLTRGLRTYGPVYALNDPHVRLATLGAAKTQVPKGVDWLTVVEHEARRAWAVVVNASPEAVNEGLLKELEFIGERLGHGRVILVIGPHAPDALRYRVGQFLLAVQRYPLFRPLTTGWVSPGTLVLVHVPEEGTGSWYGWGATARTPWTYAAAIAEALRFADSRWVDSPSIEPVAAPMALATAASGPAAVASLPVDPAGAAPQPVEPVKVKPVKVKVPSLAEIGRRGVHDGNRRLRVWTVIIAGAIVGVFGWGSAAAVVDQKGSAATAAGVGLLLDAVLIPILLRATAIGSGSPRFVRPITAIGTVLCVVMLGVGVWIHGGLG